VFDFLYSEERKVRSHAANWLEVAARVYNFRRDLLTAAQQQKLVAATDELKLRLKERAPVPKLKAAVEKLEGALREAGGRHYPVSSMVENVEFFLVAAIVILGLRAYFVQPFKIPTNSMWPTYFGMKAESFTPAQEPGWLGQAGRLLAFGAIHHAVVAPASGELMVPVFENLQLAYTQKPGRSFFIIPTVNREYTFSVNGELTRVEVPADFSEVDDVLDEQFGHGQGSWRAGLKDRIEKSGNSPESSIMSVDFGGKRMDERVYWVPLGRTVQKGEKVFSFDVLTGDLLFVDRITYNFFQPEVGQGFVFKTEKITNKNMEDLAGNQIKSYYIKRLVGTPGDTLEVRPPVLWRNGRPIDGAAAFEKNANREGKYPGYSFANRHYGIEVLTGPGETVTVPAHSYFAMGDNSPRSQDSRYWGFVPDKEVVGRPLFIYYPLSTRWGPAR
jgi:signal peptidase I